MAVRSGPGCGLRSRRWFGWRRGLRRWFRRFGVNGTTRIELRARARTPQASTIRIRSFRRPQYLVRIAALIAIEVPDARSAAPNEYEVQVPLAFEDVAQ